MSCCGSHSNHSMNDKKESLPSKNNNAVDSPMGTTNKAWIWVVGGIIIVGLVTMMF